MISASEIIKDMFTCHACGGGYAYRIATVAAAAGLLFGFDIAVINGALVFLRTQFAMWSSRVSATLSGSVSAI